MAHTLVLVGLFWNGSGAVTLSILGDPQWSWLLALLLGSLLGGYIGAHLAITQGNRWIKRVFEVITLLVGGEVDRWLSSFAEVKKSTPASRHFPCSMIVFFWKL